jgi:hypothetical protein
MNVIGDYHADGFAFIERLLPAEVTKAFMDRLWADVLNASVLLRASDDPLLFSRASELHGSSYPLMNGILWGLTPVISDIVGRLLLPSYSYFRMYAKSDRLKVHSDRAASEYGLSLTLSYSHQKPWPFEIALQDDAIDLGYRENFGDGTYSTLSMSAGDAVLYRATKRRHGRMQPNPNGWSAHLFLFWVEADGPLRHLAFEQPRNPERM